MPSPNRRGFTLLELLVVIAIVLLLSAILSPVLMKARQAGQRAVCLSNLRQLSLAFMMYCGDYTEQFPAISDKYLWMGRNWRPLVDTYVGNRAIYWCPADTTSKIMYDSTSYAYMQAFFHNASDMTAANLGGYRTCNAPIAPQGMNDVTHPDMKILIYEWFTNHEAPQRTIWQDYGPHTAAFVDGHAVMVRQESLRLNALGDHDPNWTAGGIGGQDIN